ncbi:MAG: hypothetical protein JNM81_12380 [Rhodospirillaceae bacterium]|nr:hypothetical protein [Rhodospirillaceae bacterium]
MSARTVSVATSVVPGREQALQAAALASWAKAGFSVVSLNAPHEATQVQAEHPTLKVMTATRTAEKAAGKPLPLISDLLQAAQHADPTADVVGMMNADIILREGPQLRTTLLTAASKATVLVPRVDLPNLVACANFQPSGTETYSVGYDGAFLPANAVSSIPESIFCIGMPFWDYWLPLMSLLQGHGLNVIASPVALHVDHPTRWNKSVYVFFHALVGDMMSVLKHERKNATTPALEIVSDVLHHSYNDIFERATRPDATDASQETLAALYDRIQEVVVHHIKAKAKAVLVPEAP